MAASAPRTYFGKPPPGYVPGLGRGAIGFTTRSDIGPARPAAGVKAPPPGFQSEKEDLSESNFDKFSGFNENLFGSGVYTGEDKEADAVYAAIDERMDSRRRKRREERERIQIEEYRKKRPRIQEQFRDLKRGLTTLSEDDWLAIPEARDYSRRNKRIDRDRFQKETAVPDNILRAQSLLGQQYHTMLDARQQLSGGLTTPVGSSTPLLPGGAATPAATTDLTQLGRTKDTILGMKLDRMADSVSGQTVIDPKGYLTDLNSLTKMSIDADVEDIKKARLLLQSVITTNPKHAPGWIAAARLEMETGKALKAREIITKATTVCRLSEDVWLEAASMHTRPNARAILAKAVRHIPTSVKIWLRARDLEETPAARKAVLRRALDCVPNSVKLWKEAVGQETDEDARIMLSLAVDCVPESVDMWLALAHLETYGNAKKVLNRARKAIPTDPKIWIAAAQLEESNANAGNVDKLIKACVRSMSAANVVVKRDTWLAEAEEAEKNKSVAVCEALIHNTIGIGVEDQDRKNTWRHDAQTLAGNGSFHSARAVYAHLLQTFPSKKSMWLEAANFEKQHGTSEQLQNVLQRAVKFCPQAETLWLMSAKEKWICGDVEGARAVLNSAFQANPESEDVWLAAVKLESENEEYSRARLLLQRARESSNAARVWMKSAMLERTLENHEACRELLEEGVKRFERDPKLWLMLAHQPILAAGVPKCDNKTKVEAIHKSRDIYRRGLQLCPSSVNLWLAAVRLEASIVGAFSKARSILETARRKLPKTPQLWLESIRLELRSGQTAMAEQMMAKGLQECPDSGILWAHAIAMDPRPRRKSRSFDALKRCTNNAHVFLAVGRLFWHDRKANKARNWLTRAITVDANLGDAWAYLYKFELVQEKLHEKKVATPAVKQEKDATTPTEQKKRSDSVMKKCMESAPRLGELWTQVSKVESVYEKRSLETQDVLKRVAEKINPTDLFPLWH